MHGATIRWSAGLRQPRAASSPILTTGGRRVSERAHYILPPPGASAVRALAAYRQAGGYKALEMALQSLKPEQVIDRIRESGLHGRGGAGVPVEDKWGLVRGEAEQPKYVICNAYDADL